MKYAVLKDCDWKDWHARAAKTGEKVAEVDAADLKTKDGKPLPPDLIAHFVAEGALAAVADPPAQEPPK